MHKNNLKNMSLLAFTQKRGYETQNKNLWDAREFSWPIGLLWWWPMHSHKDRKTIIETLKYLKILAILQIPFQEYINNHNYFIALLK